MNSPTIQSPSSSAEFIVAERRARRFWVSVIVGLLGLQVLGGIGTIYLATRDSSVAVIPNYYQAGLDWDITKRNRDLFVTMGWSCVVDVHEADLEYNQRMITIQVRDKLHQPVVDLRVTGQIYHHARGNDVHRLQFDQSHPGEYVAMIKMTQSGLWQMNLTFEGDHGIAEENLVIDVDSR